MKRWKWSWIVAGLVILGIAILGGIGIRNALHPNLWTNTSTQPESYAFLDRFHPETKEIDPNKEAVGFIRQFGPAPAGELPRPRMTLLVFRNQDADAVLNALTSQLTKSRGFLTGHLLSPNTDPGREWLFARGPQEGAQFADGEAAGRDMLLYEGKSITRPGLPNKCIVCIYHPGSA